MAPYNPFGRPLCDLRASNLGILREVSEGFYVEYKRELPDIKKISKSLSSFANQYGGWLFYGIQEVSKQNTKAGSFPGIPYTAVPEAQRTIREAAAKHVNPPPFYELQPVKGPCDAIGLEPGKTVLALHIPMGSEAPYVHSTGRIYRRVDDASDPVPETDRAQLELLWERSRRMRARLAEFLARVPERSEDEDINAYLHLYLLTDPTCERGYRSRLKFDRFAALMKDARPDDEKGMLVDIPLENAFVMPGGFVARQVGTYDPFRLLLTWKYYRNGSSIVTIPLNALEIGLEDGLYIPPGLEGYQQASAFVSLLRAQSRRGSVLDINILLFMLMGITHKYRVLAEASGMQCAHYAKLRFEGIWRRIAFFDTLAFTSFLKDRGLPVIQKDEALSPPGTDPDSLLELPWHDEEARGGEEPSPDIRDALWLLLRAFSAFGVPRDVIGESNEELLMAAWRAKEAHRNRAQGAPGA